MSRQIAASEAKGCTSRTSNSALHGDLANRLTRRAQQAHTAPDGTLNGDLVKVQLINAGESPVTVAARLAIGYEDSDRRELYAIIRDPHSGEIVGRRGQLYERAPHPRTQVHVLNPGDTIGTEFRLREWYEFPPGDLELRIVYDPRGATRQHPDIDAHVVASEPVPFRRAP